LKKETIIRRKDFSGAQECIGAEALTRSLMVWRLSGRKISGSERLVMRRVLEGGVGWTSGGMVLRSIDIFVLEEREVGREDWGEDSEDIVMFSRYL